MNNPITKMAIEANDKSSDISESIPILYAVASGAQYVTEFGQGPEQYGLNSTIALFCGLTHKNTKRFKTFDCYDLVYNPGLDQIALWAPKHNVTFNFHQENTYGTIIQPTDVLFIDTEHTYQHLTQELNNNHDKVSTYIVLHDTAGKYAFWEDWPYDSERRGAKLQQQPEKYGCVPAYQDFIKEHPEWHLAYQHNVNCGLAVLHRSSAKAWVDFEEINETVKLVDIL